jgi:hypothetical protein
MKMINLSKKIVLFLMVISLAACSSPITKKDKQDIAAPVNCATAQDDIQVLEAEKERVGKMIEQGVTAIFPVGAVVALLSGIEGDKLKVATGEYNDKITEKIAEIKKECNLQ